MWITCAAQVLRGREGGHHGLRDANWCRGHIRDGLRVIAAPIRRPKMLAVASRLTLLPAGAERMLRDDGRQHVLCTGSTPASGGDMVAGAAHTVRV
jgi:hypothetical protein